MVVKTYIRSGELYWKEKDIYGTEYKVFEGVLAVYDECGYVYQSYAPGFWSSIVELATKGKGN